MYGWMERWMRGVSEMNNMTRDGMVKRER